jgi:hypothetical protein
LVGLRLVGAHGVIGGERGRPRSYELQPKNSPWMLRDGCPTPRREDFMKLNALGLSALAILAVVTSGCSSACDQMKECCLVYLDGSGECEAYDDADEEGCQAELDAIDKAHVPGAPEGSSAWFPEECLSD